MRQVPLRFWLLAVVLLIVNVVGLGLIHRSLQPEGGPRADGTGALSPGKGAVDGPLGDVQVAVFSAAGSELLDGAEHWGAGARLPGAEAHLSEEMDRLILRFDRPVADAGQVGRAPDRAPFAIDPLPPGHWRWQSERELAFLLERPLPPGQEYAIRPAIDLHGILGRAVRGPDRFTVRTRALEVVGCELRSSDHRHVTFALRFNQPVEPDALAGHLEVLDTDTGQTRRPALLSRESGEELVVRALNAPSRKLTIRVKPGLTGRSGALGLEVAAEFSLNVQQPFAATRAWVRQGGRGGQMAVSLRFNAALDGAGDLPLPRMQPAVERLRARRGSPFSIELEGDFVSGVTYTATLCGSLLARDGRVLGSDQAVTFTVPERSPSLSFPLRQGFLMPGGNLLLDMEVVNVEALEVTASRVHGHNLIAHLAGQDERRTARRAVSRTIDLDLERNQQHTIALDVRQLLDTEQPSPGIYHITARATNRHWARGSAVVTLTDLAVTTHRDADGMLVWVTHLGDARPVAGAKVRAISENNQVLAAARTDGDGLARMSIPDNHPDGPPWVVTAQRGDDITFLRTDRRHWNLDPGQRAGEPWPRHYQAMLYTERGVYRPGDAVHLTGLLRQADGALAPPLPLEMRIQRPDGRTVMRQSILADPDMQGMFHFRFTPREDAQVGRYRFELALPGDADALASTTALVEAFVPARIELHAASRKPRYGLMDEPIVQVDAQYLFGQPAAGLSGTLTGRYSPAVFHSKAHPQYVFGDASQMKAKDFEPATFTLDERGRSLPTVPAGHTAEARPGLWRASGVATVTEVGGRSVSQPFKFEYDTAGRHIGLRAGIDGFAPVDEPLSIDWLLRSGDDEPAEPGPVHFQLDRIEHDFLLQEHRGQLQWRSTERIELVWKTTLGEVEDEGDGEVEPAGAGQIAITCPVPGRYRLTAEDQRTGSRTRIEFHAAHSRSQYRSMAAERPDRLSVRLDRERYEPGDLATILVESPFSGTLLLTMQTDRVVDHRVVRMNDNTVRLQWRVPEALRHGAFITATVVRAVDPAEASWLPRRAAGMARLRACHEPYRAPLTLAAPATARPGQKVTVEAITAMPIDPHRPAVVHLWAVDEGILLTSNHRTPDPIAALFAPRRAAVSIADIFADLLPDHARPAGMHRIGGDEDEAAAEAMRRSPVTTPHREPAVIWRSAAEVAPDGRLIAELTMPQVNTRMRLMAVVADHDRYNAAEVGVVVASPLMVETSWPRFAAPGDGFEVPLRIYNTSDEPMDVEIDLALQGGLEVDATALEGTHRIEPGTPLRLWLHATATQEVGPAEVTVQARRVLPKNGDDEAVDEVQPLTAHWSGQLIIRPVAPLQTEHALVRIEPGRTLEMDLTEWMVPGTATVRVDVAPTAVVELAPALLQLVDYPYGCLEQVTSRLLAIAAVPQLLHQQGEDDRGMMARHMIAAGIDTLWSMQTRSGGLAYWPGQVEPTAWGTAYAADFLLRAREGGFDVDAAFMGAIADYLQGVLGDRQAVIDDATRAMIVRVLAGFGRVQHGWLARLTEAADGLDAGARADLAEAWLAAGRRDMAQAVLDEPAINPDGATTSRGRLTSPLAQQARQLEVLLLLDRDHPSIPALVRRLEAARKQGHWGTTLNNAAALAALSRYQVQQDRPAAWTAHLELPPGEAVSFDSSAPFRHVVRGAGGAVHLRTEGEGTAFVAITAEGLVQREHIREHDQNLSVRRRWLDREGRPLDATSLKVGDLVQVEIDLIAPGRIDGERMDNIAIVDALPAGLEVENPRLATSATAGEAERDGRPDRVEFLDDRVILFTPASAQQRTFRYTLRAVSAGRFALPPIQASAMYDPSYASVHGMGEVVIGR